MILESTPGVTLNAMNPLLRIGEIASRAGVTVDTVRFYERKGLMDTVARDASGARRFPATAVDRIRVIRRATAIGFTLDELVRIFKRRASGQTPCGHVLESAKQKLTELDERIAELQSLRTTLADVIATWEVRIDQAPRGGLAYLLESLNGEQK